MSIQKELEAAKQAYSALEEAHAASSETLASLGDKINELEAKASGPEVHEPQVGDVYENGLGEMVLLTGDNGNVYLTSSGSLKTGRSGAMCHSDFKGTPSWTFKGRADGLLFTREQIKEKFMKMKDEIDDTGERCSKYAAVFHAHPACDFIENLLDDRNCDGSPVES
jgi:hypothetical protein